MDFPIPVYNLHGTKSAPVPALQALLIAAFGLNVSAFWLAEHPSALTKGTTHD